MLRLFFILLGAACCAACDKNPAVYTVGTGPVSVPQKTFLALGDSYTSGQSVPFSDRFPDQTVALLRSRGITIDAPDYLAVTGWNTFDLKHYIELRNPSQHDVVTLLIGVNDQYQTHDTSGYRQRFTALLEKSIQLARGKKQNVFVLSIPDYSVMPVVSPIDRPRISLEIDWFNAINKSVTESYDVAYLDITYSSRDAAHDPTLIAPDGLHYSGLEYKKWADRLSLLMELALR